MTKTIRYILLTLMLIVMLSVPTSARTALSIGASHPAFANAVKRGRIKLRRVKVGRTTLICDVKIPKKRVRAVRRWISFLPKKVQKTARRVYFLRRSAYLKTGGADLENTLGYEIFEEREIYFYSTADYDDMQAVLYHEFGHAYDNRTGKYLRYSSSAEWHKIGKGSGNRAEYFAECFADYFAFLYTREARFISRLLKGGR